MDEDIKINLTIADLKRCIEDLPDDMPVIIPIVDEDDANKIYAFRHVRTLGTLRDLLLSPTDEDAFAFCLNAADGGVDIFSQIKYSGKDSHIKCERVIF